MGLSEGDWVSLVQVFFIQLFSSGALEHVLEGKEFEDGGNNPRAAGEDNADCPSPWIESPLDDLDTRSTDSENDGLQDEDHGDDSDHEVRLPDALEDVQRVIEDSAVEEVSQLEHDEHIEVVGGVN